MSTTDLAFEFTGKFISFSMKDNGLGRNISQGGDKVMKAVAAVMDSYAPQVEAYAKTHAPWTDRTGNARNGLAARSFQDGTNAGIILYHQVPYGIWLEVRWSGQYAIIDPTISVMGPQVMAGLNGMLDRMGFA